jgi:hypothetical protein
MTDITRILSAIDQGDPHADEPEAHRLVTACGLDWEPACPEFHETSRPVRTASVTQVRQPLYRKSVARWKAYEPYLKPLFDRLPDKADFRPLTSDFSGCGMVS